MLAQRKWNAMNENGSGLGTLFQSGSLISIVFFFHPKIPINSIFECALERYFLPFEILTTVNHLYRHTYLPLLLKNRTKLKVLKKEKKGSILFPNSLNESCNDVNYYKFQCILHTDHPVWHRSQPLNLQPFVPPDNFTGSIPFCPLTNNETIEKWKPLKIPLWYTHLRTFLRLFFPNHEQMPHWMCFVSIFLMFSLFPSKSTARLNRRKSSVARKCFITDHLVNYVDPR